MILDVQNVSSVFFCILEVIKLVKFVNESRLYVVLRYFGLCVELREAVTSLLFRHTIVKIIFGMHEIQFFNIIP